MKNDCLILFIVNGLVFHGAKESSQKLIDILRHTIYPELPFDSEIPPIPEVLALTTTKELLEQHIPSCELAFTPLNTIPYEDYLGYCESLLTKNAYIGLGYDPKRLFNGQIISKHVSTISKFSRHGLHIEDPELEVPTFRSWENVEKDTLPVNGGFWILNKKELR